MDDPLARKHDRARGKDVAVDGILLQRASSDDPRRREQSHRLGEDGARVREPREIVRAERVGRDGVDLVVQTSLDIRVLCEEIPAPREEIRRRLVTGEEERHRLVAELTVAHSAAVALGVVREEKHREQVAAILPRRATFGDEAVDRRVEPLAAATEAQRRRDGELLEQLAEGEHAEVERFDRRSERLADLVRLALDVGVEQRLADDGERVRRHLARHVERRAVAPAFRAPCGVRRHGVGVRGDARAVKGGLRQTTLAQMELVLARQEPLAEEHPRALETATLVEVATVRDEHVADPVGMAHEHDRLAGDTESGNVAVGASQIGEERERPPDHRERELTGITLARTGDGERRVPRWRVRRRAGSSHTVFSSPSRRQNCT